MLHGVRSLQGDSLRPTLFLCSAEANKKRPHKSKVRPSISFSLRLRSGVRFG